MAAALMSQPMTDVYDFRGQTLPQTGPAQPCIFTQFKRLLTGTWKLSHHTSKDVLYNIVEIEKWIRSNIDAIIHHLSEEASRNRRFDGHVPFPLNKDSILDEQQPCVLVLGILMASDHGSRIQVFREAGFRDDQLENTHELRRSRELHDNLVRLTRDRSEDDPHTVSTDVASCISLFETWKWHFCPQFLELGMVENLQEGVHLPFARKDLIGHGGTSKVYRVLVHENFVKDALRQVLGSPEEYKDHGRCYVMALKSYPHESYPDYVHERNILSRLSPTSRSEGEAKLDGVIEYFGAFSMPKDPDNDLKRTHNLLLEYGPYDLEMYLASDKISPPSSIQEILKFWSSIFDIARILHEMQSLKFSSTDIKSLLQWDGVHSDVKPANILYANKRFKLIDFGFAAFKPTTRKSKIEAAGCTETYGAPEMWWQTGVTQTIDTWSFGCVLVVVATWIVLGRHDVLTFEQLRVIGNKQESTERNETAVDPAAPSASDSFHNGRRPLRMVTGWISKLKNEAKICDTVTVRVLELVEKHMLLENPTDRYLFDKICERWNGICQEAQVEYSERLKKGQLFQHQDEELVDRALKAIEKAKLESTSSKKERTKLQSSLEISMDGNQTVEIPAYLTSQDPGRVSITSQDPSRVSKQDVLKQVSSRITPHRLEAIEEKLSSAQSKNREAHPTHPDVKPTNKGKAPARELAHVIRSSRPHTRNPLSKPVSAKVSGTVVTEEASAPIASVGSVSGTTPADLMFGADDGIRVGQLPAQKLPSIQQIPSTASPAISQNQLPEATAVRTQLPSPVLSQPNGDTISLTQSPGPIDSSPVQPHPFPSPSSKNQVSRGSQLWHPKSISELPWEIFTVRTTADDAKSKWHGLLQRFNPRKNRQDQLGPREMTFIVDTAATMSPHKYLLAFIVETLCLELSQCSNTHPSLLFTNGGRDIRERGSGEAFKTAILNDSLWNQYITKTDMSQVLEREFIEYRSRFRSTLTPPNPKTLLIITDGIWSDMEDDMKVEDLLVKFITDIKKLWPGIHDRHFTIQFIRIDDDEKAISRLKRLDDDLKKEKVYEINGKPFPDVVDHTYWQGRVGKMIVGSFRHGTDIEKEASPDPIPDNLEDLIRLHFAKSRRSSRHAASP